MAKGPVIFDLDDTLVSEEPVARASLRGALELLLDLDAETSIPIAFSVISRTWTSGPFHALCLDLGISSWEGLWSSFDGNHVSVSGLREWAPTYRVDAWTSVLHELGIGQHSLAEQMSERYIEAQRVGHSPIAGASEVVGELASTHRLGLLTNGPSDIQRLKLDGSGLRDNFEGVTISGEIGIGKPAAAAFIYALDQLGAKPENSTMVGDSWDRDIIGAISVGMSAVWISSGRSTPAPIKEVTVIERINELTNVMK